ncbi:nucleoside deaminase [Agromyces atrinae]|uniref:nucleoside deaminase n=1 Tax=Agromyces atrinae TaxID=592376 RepID=UPI001F565D94|nr:nucleoside deaminase [Agromyces atrinae]MCI2957153.1 nucleoside deaminase [Agromyces atrinae]
MALDYEGAVRRAIQVSADARAHGNHPFGAILLAPDGTIALEAENTVTTGDDVTNHAETNLVRLAWRAIPHDELPDYTLVTSCEPCAMCAGAIYWSGIDTVVFGLSESGLLALTGNHPDNSTMSLPCRQVFAAGGREVTVVGPLLEDEAAEHHRDFWD